MDVFSKNIPCSFLFFWTVLYSDARCSAHLPRCDAVIIIIDFSCTCLLLTMDKSMIQIIEFLIIWIWKGYWIKNFRPSSTITKSKEQFHNNYPVLIGILISKQNVLSCLFSFLLTIPNQEAYENLCITFQCNFSKEIHSSSPNRIELHD